MVSASQRAAEQRSHNLGLRMAALLAVLTIVEYIVAVSVDSSQALVLFLAPVAVVKAWVIIVYFMHVSKVWRGEGSH
ncbi:MAG: cytochrome C oxidase subunit IV family protein [Dehalococcoidia bacterium]